MEAITWQPPALGGWMEHAPPSAYDLRVARPLTSFTLPMTPLTAATDGAPLLNHFVDSQHPQAPPSLSPRQPYQPLALSEPEPASRPVLARVAIDLDGTMIHMIPPARGQDSAEVAEMSILVRTLHGPYDIHVRIGAANLLRRLRASGVEVCIATRNMYGRKICDELGVIEPAWRDLHVVVFGHEHNKSISALEFEPRFADASSKGVTKVLDDQRSVWVESDRDLVVKLKEFSIHRPVDRENTYLTRLLFDLERDFAMPLDNAPPISARPAIRNPSTLMTRPAATPAAPRRGGLAHGDMYMRTTRNMNVTYASI